MMKDQINLEIKSKLSEQIIGNVLMHFTTFLEKAVVLYMRKKIILLKTTMTSL